MKLFRCAVVVMCALLFVLAATPPVAAGTFWPARDTLVFEGPRGFVARWLERLTEWIGWEDDGGELQAVVEANGCSIEPNGTPCQ